ncbi:MAG TPA: GntG family PLP-dependent aldolase [Bacteroidota bacterium]|nr:GntG family PLP-dependent aldolase [Bacteroidota bacterium]
MQTIDLRSDTVTRPSPGMREAMKNAEVGDDVYGEDPTVNRLQETVAAMFGREAALFVPTGTMGNEVCVKLFTEPGDEIIAGEDSHLVVYETGGPGLLSGVQIRPLATRRGVIDPEDARRAFRPDTYYYPRTRLVCVENTHGRSGGAVYPLDDLRELWQVTRDAGIQLHMDGARIWNASAASGVSYPDYARYADSLSVCFSKGLGAPVGSMIIADRKTIELARRYRKIFGGGMRQAGILAAAAEYALVHNLPKLSDDHEKARVFASELEKSGRIAPAPGSVETNMVIFDVSGTGRSRDDFLTLLAGVGVLLTPERDDQVRAVMHLDVSRDEAVLAGKRIVEAL